MTKIAVVTGGTRGIGAAISIALRDAGIQVAANYLRNDDRARDFSKSTGINAYQWDVADLDACSEAVKKIEVDQGPIDILVNNAGITRDSSLRKMTREMWDDVIRVNLGGCFNMTKVVFEGMLARKYGRIVNISSINGQTGQFGQVNYSAAKAGVIGFTKALALEGAKAGVTVNAVAPGYVQTEMVAAVPAEILSQIVARIPVGRLAQAQEIANLVRFLCSDDAQFITGATMSVNGGQAMI